VGEEEADTKLSLWRGKGGEEGGREGRREGVAEDVYGRPGE